MKLYIKETASKYGISITKLAELMDVNRQTVYYYIEQGDKNPLCQIEKIANTIGCSIEELYGAKENEQSFSCPHCGKPIEITLGAK